MLCWCIDHVHLLICAYGQHTKALGYLNLGPSNMMQWNRYKREVFVVSPTGSASGKWPLPLKDLHRSKGQSRVDTIWHCTTAGGHAGQTWVDAIWQTWVDTIWHCTTAGNGFYTLSPNGAHPRLAFAMPRELWAEIWLQHCCLILRCNKGDTIFALQWADKAQMFWYHSHCTYWVSITCPVSILERYFHMGS